MKAANLFLQKTGFGHGIRTSRMFQPSDVAMLRSNTIVVNYRPRGVLSGFLVVVPNPNCVVYIPPQNSKQSPRIVRMRLSNAAFKEGGILSCYWDSVGDLVIEDILMWEGKNLYQTVGFEERWTRWIPRLCAEWESDDIVQGCGIQFAEYVPLAEIKLPEGRKVVEFVPTKGANQKRCIWIPSEDESAPIQTMIARRESHVGPDIYSLWLKGEKQPSWALVRTLELSKSLRFHGADEFRVLTTWNEMFERHEIKGVA